MSNIDQIAAMTADLEDGAEIYVTPSVRIDKAHGEGVSDFDNCHETKYTLSAGSKVSLEIRLSELEPIAKKYGWVWSESSKTYKMKVSKRLIDTIGE